MSENNELFLKYFKENLKVLIDKIVPSSFSSKPTTLPDDYWQNHVCSTFVETVRWWIANGMNQTPQTITEYFNLAINGNS